MAKKVSAGILLYRRTTRLEVFLVHPGGPFWAKKDLGSWSLPKGELEEGEDPLERAKLELAEETGFHVDGEFRPLTAQKQPSGKTIHAWSIEGDCDPAHLRSNTFSVEWPPKSGQHREFPEVDRAAWFDVPEALRRVTPGQAEFIEELARLLGLPSEPKAASGDPPAPQGSLF
jgi:predicted NUDIX family NTP pyrophosphohydrolase